MGWVVGGGAHCEMERGGEGNESLGQCAPPKWTPTPLRTQGDTWSRLCCGAGRQVSRPSDTPHFNTAVVREGCIIYEVWGGKLGGSGVCRRC